MKLILLLVTSVYAFKFYPLNQTIYPHKNSSTVFFIENNSKKNVGVQLKILKRNMNELGKENNTPVSSSDFMIFPPQAILKPGQKKTVRITWTKGSVPKKELNYRVVAEQLPIDFNKNKKKKGASINILLKYLGALYIAPKEAESKIVSRIVGKKGGNLTVEFENLGNKHQILKNLKIKFYNDKGKEVVLQKNSLKGVNGENILANSKRKFSIDVNKNKQINKNWQIGHTFE